MSDYVKWMTEAWHKEGPQAAFDMGNKLLSEIEAEVHQLEWAKNTIRALAVYLRETGLAEDNTEFPKGDVVIPSHRANLIMEAAYHVKFETSSSTITVQDVLQELNNRGLDLGVKQPLAVIGTVLARADDWTKIARNTFEFTPAPRSADDLPF